MKCVKKAVRRYFLTRACSSTETCLGECLGEAVGLGSEEERICGGVKVKNHHDVGVGVVGSESVSDGNEYK